MQMLIQPPVQLHRDRDTLFLPSNPQELRPLHKKLCMILCHLSRDTSLTKPCQQQLPQSWKIPGGQSLRKQYSTYLRKWRGYCSLRVIDLICPSVENGIKFPTELYESGIGYCAINTERSAISSRVTLPEHTLFVIHPRVCCFL